MSSEFKHLEGQCVANCVRQLSRIVTAIYDDQLAATGLKASQLSVLVAVANRESPTPADIVKDLHLDESTVSRNVERMCAKGWLRIAAGQDRRSHFIEITVKGRAMIRKSLSAWRRAQDEIGKRLSAKGIADLRSSLRRIAP